MPYIPMDAHLPKGILANSMSGKSAKTLNPESSTSPPPSTMQPFPLPSPPLTSSQHAIPLNT